MWGGVLDSVLTKYHWTLDYTLWGVSFLNIQMLLSDSVQIFYDSKNNKKGKKTSGKVISGDDPKNIAYFTNL